MFKRSVKNILSLGLLDSFSSYPRGISSSSASLAADVHRGPRLGP